jgi:hypothetical protein
MIPRVRVALLKAWLAGSLAPTALLVAKSGLAASKMLLVFAPLLGIWLVPTGAVALLLRNRPRLMLAWMYGASVAGAFVAAILFFVLFVYPLMVCIPVGMLVAAVAFHVVVRQPATQAVCGRSAPPLDSGSN